MRDSSGTLLSLVALLLLITACVPLAPEQTAAEPVSQDETACASGT
ncbi:MAG: hypothetical protein OXJ55_22050 [Caldilineaceae bacterium]|nr:hypothetical protein [Caldilineaceae bacterium]